MEIKTDGEYLQGVLAQIPTLRQPGTFPVEVNRLAYEDYLVIMSRLGERSRMFPLRHNQSPPPLKIAADTVTIS